MVNHHDQVTAARLKKLEQEMNTVNKRLVEVAQEMNRRTMQLAHQCQALANSVNTLGQVVGTMKEENKA